VSTATELVNVIAKAPTGFGFAPTTASLGTLEGTGSSLTANTLIGTFGETGGNAGDSFILTFGGPGATAFSSNQGTLSTGSAAVSGSSTGALYALTVQINDTTNGTNSGPLPFDLVVGTGSGDTINLTQGAQNLGLVATTPTFIYGLAGNETINAAGMTGPVWIAAGAGQDSLTGGSGADTYLFGATAESTPALPDIITNFNVSLDKIDLTGIGSTPLTFRSSKLTGSTVASNSIAWQQSGGNTFVYVNNTGSNETTTTANMTIQLNGTLTLTASDFVHH
jgi:Peptidase M10 serralysin C terminal